MVRTKGIGKGMRNLLASYVGHQMRILDSASSARHCGEIASLNFFLYTMVVRFRWLSRYDETAGLWIKDETSWPPYDERTYMVPNMNVFEVSKEKSKGMLVFNGSNGGTTLCFVREGNKASLRKVQVVGYHNADLPGFMKYLRTVSREELGRYVDAWSMMDDAAVDAILDECKRRNIPYG